MRFFLISRTSTWVCIIRSLKSGISEIFVTPHEAHYTVQRSFELDVWKVNNSGDKIVSDQDAENAENSHIVRRTILNCQRKQRLSWNIRDHLFFCVHPISVDLLLLLVFIRSLVVRFMRLIRFVGLFHWNIKSAGFTRTNRCIYFSGR